MKKKKGLICFDLDNPLIHRTKAHIIAFQKSLRKHEHNNITNKQLSDKFGVSSRIYLKELIPGITAKEINSIRKLHGRYLKETSKKYAHKIRGVTNALKELKKDYKIAIVTNCTKNDVDIFMKNLDMDFSLFDKIITNTRNLRPKPAPDEIIKAEKLLKLKADYMIGDTVYDIMAAKKAGIKCIAVASGLQSKSKLKKARPYAVLKSVKDLPGFLKKS